MVTIFLDLTLSSTTAANLAHRVKKFCPNPWQNQDNTTPPPAGAAPFCCFRKSETFTTTTHRSLPRPPTTASAPPPSAAAEAAAVTTTAAAMTTASTTSSSSTIDWTLGARVKVTTLLDHEIIGTIYSLCQTTNTIALIQESPAASSSPSQPAASSASPNYRIIKTSFIKDVTPLDNAKSKRADASSQSPPPSAASVAAGTPHRDAFARAVPTVGPVQIATIEARARAAVKAERERRAKIGVGVTREAQDLFDLISKTVPCRWHDKSIIAMDEVRIDAPYRSSNCVADDPKSGALRYVKMLVDGAREKMEKSKGG